MKTKFFKFGLPFGVFMMAIAFAFASENKSSEKEALVTGYIFQAGNCIPAPKDCNNLGGIPCTQGASQVWATDNGTTCSDMLYHRP